MSKNTDFFREEVNVNWGRFHLHIWDVLGNSFFSNFDRKVLIKMCKWKRPQFTFT